ncbi:ATP-grasp domain-containing protein [Pseudonocardia acaciae]|uniref:carboxylate--amine ligase n=1 Tax=Pseudonocardia acaciae TaxID=551276 RepID=UPI00048A6640|nr:ATP-grasp domain-containing protein [Pseudonocardia acaciae]
MEPAIVIGSRMQGLAVIRALGSMGVPVVVLRYHRGDMGYRSRWVREVVGCAHPEQEPELFLATLERLAERFPGALLVPPSDTSVAAVATHAQRLAGLGYVLAAPPPDVVANCLDKPSTYRLARSHQVPAPVGFVLDTPEELDRFTAEAKFPAVLKPTVSHRYKAVFGRKWTRVDGAAQALTHYREAREAGFDVLIQELIPGDELCGANYNAYAWDGGCVDLTAAKIRNSPAETGSPSVVVSRKIPELAEAGRRLLAALGYLGYANVEFKRDPRDGLYKLIEVNARHNLSAQLAIRAGVNFPRLEYLHRMYGETPAQRDYAEGVHWIDITRDLRAAPSYLRRADYSVRRFVRPYLTRPVFAVASRRDPLPAVIRSRHTAARAFGLLRAKLAA